MRKKLFSGLVVLRESFNFIPHDLPRDIDKIRDWAFKQGLIIDEFQIIDSEREKELSKIFQSEELLIAVHVYKATKDFLDYAEYPYVPLKTLIKKKMQIDLTSWRVNTSKVEFCFWYDDIEELFYSISNAKRIVKKFYELSKKLKHYEIEKEIKILGNIQARFFKNGRCFDVEFKLKNKF